MLLYKQLLLMTFGTTLVCVCVCVCVYIYIHTKISRTIFPVSSLVIISAIYIKLLTLYTFELRLPHWLIWYKKLITPRSACLLAV